MPQRVIDPPLSELDRLANPLNGGERLLIEFFNDYLPPAWEIYIQPHLNGLRPDLVLLNPAVGIAVFEVKDWNLDRVDYFVKSRNGKAELAAHDRQGKRIVLTHRNRNPLEQVKRYEDEMLNLYCPRLETSYGRSAHQAVTAGIVLTGATTNSARALLEPLLKDESQQYRDRHPISGFDDLRPGRMSVVFPESGRASSTVMTEQTAQDLRAWLREPAFSREQRAPLLLDSRQRQVATTRTATGYRRVKGPAGLGKTVALAARAVELASQNQRVLVCTYNVTLMNYVRDMARQWARTRGLVRPNIEFLNFHHWCKRVCYFAGKGSEYDELLSQAKQRESRETTFNEHIPLLAESVLRDPANSQDLQPYDAILVDEGQDFRLNWWSALRASLAPGGEMLLVADKTQNVYGTAGAWTEGSMTGAGFRGEWLQLERSYRLPPSVIPLLKLYSERYLIGEDVDIPETEQQELDLFPVELKWVQTVPASAPDACVSAILEQMEHLRPTNAATDIVFLAGHEIGAAVVQVLEGKNIRVRHTFDDGQVFGRGRRLKLAFFQGAERVKATTLHSFKGWEAAQLVIYVDSAASPRDRAVFYAALTRLKRLEAGSALTVVSSARNLVEFGRQWPSFQKFRAPANAASRD